jgi:hypothetical protein
MSFLSGILSLLVGKRGMNCYVKSTALCKNSNFLLASRFMPAGSKPGERRGGRKKGTLNKATLERRAIYERAVGSFEGKLAKEVIRDAMLRMVLLAQKYDPELGVEPDEGKFEKYQNAAVAFATNLVGYESPKLATVKVGEDRENPFMVREGVTSNELKAELLDMFMRGMRPSNGELPELMDLTTGEIIDADNSPVEATDGVANREE